MSTTNNKDTLHIRVKDKTLKQIDILKVKFNAPSRSDVIRRAIDIYSFLATATDNSARIIVEYKDEVREITLPELAIL